MSEQKRYDIISKIASMIARYYNTIESCKPFAESTLPESTYHMDRIKELESDIERLKAEIKKLLNDETSI